MTEPDTKSYKIWMARYNDLVKVVHSFRANMSWIIERLEESEALTADGLEGALIGVTEDNRAVYSTDLCLGIFMENGMTHEEAREHFEYNTLRALDYQDADRKPVFVQFAVHVPRGT